MKKILASLLCSLTACTMTASPTTVKNEAQKMSDPNSPIEFSGPNVEEVEKNTVLGTVKLYKLDANQGEPTDPIDLIGVKFTIPVTKLQILVASNVFESSRIFVENHSDSLISLSGKFNDNGTNRYILDILFTSSIDNGSPIVISATSTGNYGLSLKGCGIPHEAYSSATILQVNGVVVEGLENTINYSWHTGQCG